MVCNRQVVIMVCNRQVVTMVCNRQVVIWCAIGRYDMCVIGRW